MTFSTFCWRGRRRWRRGTSFSASTSAAAGRAWLAGLVDKVGTGQSVGTASPDARWVTIAFTCNGLRALGVDDTRAGDVPGRIPPGDGRAGGDSRHRRQQSVPIAGSGDLASPALHAIVILFARDVAERDRCERQHRDYLSTLTGVTVLSALNLEALPPFDGVAREHFGYRDRLSQPVIAGTGEQPTPGSGPPVKAGEFFLGYDDESGAVPPLPQPELLSRNGSYLAYLRMEEHVGAFREFLRQQAETPDQQELLAAKLMGRWRSGAPLVLCPGQGRSGARRRSAADQRLSVQGRRPARLSLPDRLAHPADEPARHRREHAAPEDDPPRRHLRPAAARRARRTMAWSGASRPSSAAPV